MSDLLAADVGNSATKVGLFQGARLRLHLTFPTEQASAAAIRRILDRSFREKGQSLSAARDFALCTVVPDAAKMWRQVAGLLGARIFFIKGDTPTPLRSAYRKPTALGPDRLAAAVGAAHICGAPVIVVNFGTATTVDAVSADGRFLGGAICLGMGAALDALASATSLLPRVAASKAVRPIGRDTRESILAGSFFGHIGQVNEIVARQRALLGQNTPVVAAGGFAHLIARHIRGPVLIRPTLTLQGMSLIWRHNQPPRRSSR